MTLTVTAKKNPFAAGGQLTIAPGVKSLAGAALSSSSLSFNV